MASCTLKLVFDCTSFARFLARPVFSSRCRRAERKPTSRKRYSELFITIGVLYWYCFTPYFVHAFVIYSMYLGIRGGQSMTRLIPFSIHRILMVALQISLGTTITIEYATKAAFRQHPVMMQVWSKVKSILWWFRGQMQTPVKESSLRSWEWTPAELRFEA